MSKIWKKPIAIPAWVEVAIDNNLVKVKWPKWELSQKILDCVNVKVEDGQVVTSITNDENKPFWGLSRSLINNMIELLEDLESQYPENLKIKKGD